MNQTFNTPKKRLNPGQWAQMKDAAADLEYRIGQRLILEANPSRYRKMYDQLESWRGQLGFKPHSSTVAEHFKPLPELHLIEQEFARKERRSEPNPPKERQSPAPTQAPRRVEDDPNYKRLRKKKQEVLDELKTFPQTGPLAAPQAARKMQLVIDLANLDLQLKEKRANWKAVTTPGAKGTGKGAAPAIHGAAAQELGIRSQGGARYAHQARSEIEARGSDFVRLHPGASEAIRLAALEAKAFPEKYPSVNTVGPGRGTGATPAMDKVAAQHRMTINQDVSDLTTSERIGSALYDLGKGTRTTGEGLFFLAAGAPQSYTSGFSENEFQRKGKDSLVRADSDWRSFDQHWQNLTEPFVETAPAFHLIPDDYKKLYKSIVTGDSNPYSGLSQLSQFGADPLGTLDALKKGFTDIARPDATREEKILSAVNYAGLLITAATGTVQGVRAYRGWQSSPKALTQYSRARTALLGSSSPAARTALTALDHSFEKIGFTVKEGIAKRKDPNWDLAIAKGPRVAKYGASAEVMRFADLASQSLKFDRFEKLAIKAYKGELYRAINHYMRFGKILKGADPILIPRLTESLRSAFRKSKGLPYRTELYRTTNLEEWHKLTPDDIGKSLKPDPAFISTANYEKHVWDRLDAKKRFPVILKIEAPKGTKALPTSFKIIDEKLEFEYLLDGYELIVQGRS